MLLTFPTALYAVRTVSPVGSLSVPSRPNGSYAYAMVAVLAPLGAISWLSRLSLSYV
jgi:hypothetical protein